MVRVIFDEKDKLVAVPSSWYQAPEALGFLRDEGVKGVLLFTMNPFSRPLS